MHENKEEIKDIYMKPGISLRISHNYLILDVRNIKPEPVFINQPNDAGDTDPYSSIYNFNDRRLHMEIWISLNYNFKYSSVEQDSKAIFPMLHYERFCETTKKVRQLYHENIEVYILLESLRQKRKSYFLQLECAC